MNSMNLSHIPSRVAARIRYLCQRIAYFVYAHTHSMPHVMSAEETVARIQQDQLSISRFGDGEIQLIAGYDLNFQKYDADLARKLRETMHSEGVLVCLPDIFEKGHLKKYILNSQKFWEYCLVTLRPYWFRDLRPNTIYEMSRFYMTVRDKTDITSYVAKLKQLWEQRDVVFIEGKESRLGVGNDLFDNARSIRRILGPVKNAFEHYESLMQGVREHCNRADLLILALGPTATVMANDLAKEGYQALDLGHIDIEYEWWKMGATKKVPVPGKFCNEAYLDRNSAAETPDDTLLLSSLTDYRKQIIADFS